MSRTRGPQHKDNLGCSRIPKNFKKHTLPAFGFTLWCTSGWCLPQLWRIWMMVSCRAYFRFRFSQQKVLHIACSNTILTRHICLIKHKNDLWKVHHKARQVRFIIRVQQLARQYIWSVLMASFHETSRQMCCTLFLEYNLTSHPAGTVVLKLRHTM